ncbi:MAG: NAD(P)H-hydrate dehydratase [Pseudomonadota bacterium]
MDTRRKQIILTPAAMGEVDAAAIGSGIDGYGLMQTAGSAISACVLKNYPQAESAVILCGPGNNGGDGYVAARFLRAAGMPAKLFSLSEPKGLKGDAARAYADWGAAVEPISDLVANRGTVIVDALFGAGLDRPIQGAAAAAMEVVLDSGLPVVAADLPSGINGRSGRIEGIALKAAHTVTFAAYKPGHFLFPGADHCGALELIDIGIPQRVIDSHSENLWRNEPCIWSASLPELTPSGHKYMRGHLGVFSGGHSHTGAARLAAQSALRSGAGLVTVLTPASAAFINASHLSAVMLRSIDDLKALDDLLADKRFNGFVLGPGFGVGDKARQFVTRIARAKRQLVLDADGITAFSDHPDHLFSSFKGGETRLILTPHEGEFKRLFPDLEQKHDLSKVDRARIAAERANGIVVYKGADTVVAAPDGRAVINANAPPWLATAGSGDCLAGIAGALLVQGVPPFEAASAAVYFHALAARRAGPGLTADDLALHVPAPGSI